MCPKDILEKYISGRGNGTDKVPEARVCWANWMERKEAKMTGVEPATELYR